MGHTQKIPSFRELSHHYIFYEFKNALESVFSITFEPQIQREMSLQNPVHHLTEILRFVAGLSHTCVNCLPQDLSDSFGVVRFCICVFYKYCRLADRFVVRITCEINPRCCQMCVSFPVVLVLFCSSRSFERSNTFRISRNIIFDSLYNKSGTFCSSRKFC